MIAAEQISSRTRLAPLIQQSESRAQNAEKDNSSRPRNRISPVTNKNVRELKALFHGKMDRANAATLLLADGDFLVRLAKSVEDLTYQPVLSVKWGPRHYHFLIKERYSLFWIESVQFSSIKALVKHYVQQQKPVTLRSGVLLKRAVECKQYNPAMARTREEKWMEESGSAESPPNLATVSRSISYNLLGENAPNIMKGFFQIGLVCLFVMLLYFCTLF